MSSLPDGVTVDIYVRFKRPGEVEPRVHLPFNRVGRWACGQGAGGGRTSLRTNAVTCGGCRRTRAYASAAVVEAAEARVTAQLNARYEHARRVRALTWLCPLCEGSGDEAGPGGGGAGRCLHCAGEGLVSDEQAAGWEGAQRAPRPPAVRRTPCHDCAFRPFSQEDENNQALPDSDSVFFCHQGLSMNAHGEYVPLLWAAGLPVGSLVCAGWWDIAVCGQAPALAPAVYPQVEGVGGSDGRGGDRHPGRVA